MLLLACQQFGVRYAAQGGGKRVRPLLVYAAGSLGDAEAQVLDAAAVAIECIHAYSLVQLCSNPVKEGISHIYFNIFPIYSKQF